jgi:ribosomal protein S18 acetylase RimI-like enzyme
MADYTKGVRNEVAAVFVDAYYKELRFFTKDKNKLIKAFRHSFCPEVIYLAELEGEIISMLGCSNNKMRAMYIDPNQLKKHLGFFIGPLAYRFMHKEFNTPLTYPDHTGYIECVATMEKARGKGAATSLMKQVLELPYQEFILEVADNNQTAYQLYKKMGFAQIKRKREKFSKIKGFKERIYMCWSR